MMMIITVYLLIRTFFLANIYISIHQGATAVTLRKSDEKDEIDGKESQ